MDLVRVPVAGDQGTRHRMAAREMGGLARLATLIKSLRQAHPASIVMNIGDTYHGGVEALYTRGNAVAAAVNALGIDIGVPGNWDFAYGPAVTRLRYGEAPQRLAAVMNFLTRGNDIARPNFPNLAANLFLTTPLSSGDRLLAATRIITAGGVDIGFIGLTADIVPRMAAPLSWGFAFTEGAAEYQTLVDGLARELRDRGSQIVVVMSELGLHKNLRLADVIAPGVDIIFSAHTHEVTPRPVIGASGALVVEAGDDGYVGLMHITVTPGAAPQYDWALVAVDRAIADDPEVAALVAAARAPFLDETVDMSVKSFGPDLRLSRPIDTIIGRGDDFLHRRHALDSPFNRMLGATMRSVAGTQIALTPGFRFDVVIAPPPTGDGAGEDKAGAGSAAVTIEDIYRLLPMSVTLVTASVSGARLREIIEQALTDVFSPDFFRHSGGWMGGLGGLEVELDLSRPDGARVLSLRLTDTGAVIEDGDMISVVSCQRPFDDSDVLCSKGGFVDIKPLKNPLTGDPWTPVEMLINAYESGHVRVPAPPAVHDHSGLTQWPENPLFQPINAARADNHARD